MNRAKRLCLGVIIGVLIGVVFCLISYFVEVEGSLSRSIEMAISYLVAAALFISMKLELSEMLRVASVVVYCGLLGGIFSFLMMLKPKTKYVIFVAVIVLLVVVHKNCIGLIEEEIRGFIEIADDYWISIF